MSAAQALGGSAWGLKVDVIRPGHVSGQNLWASWPDQAQGRAGHSEVSSLLPGGGQEGLIPTGGGTLALLAPRRMFKSQGGHKAEKVLQERVPVAAQPPQTSPQGVVTWAGLLVALSAA